MLWLALIAAAFLGGVVQTITGFGAGVVIMMFLPHFFDLLAAPAINSSICIGLSGTLTWKYRKSLKARLFLIPLLIYSFFALVCIQLVKGFDLEWLGTAFAVFLILLSLYSLFMAKNAAVKPTPVVAFVCSMISGICGALFGIGGPLMALYFSAITTDREEYVANVQLVFFVSGVLLLGARVMNGLYTLSLLPMTIVGILCIRVGSRVGMLIAERIPTQALRKIVYLAVGVSGVIMLIEKIF